MEASRTDSAERYREEQKLAFEFVKHVTTLATGTIVLLAGLLEKLFADPHWRGLVPATFVCLIASTALLTTAALGLIASVRGPVGGSSGVRALTGLSTTGGLGAFLMGLTLLSVFAVRNWI